MDLFAVRFRSALISRLQVYYESLTVEYARNIAYPQKWYARVRVHNDHARAMPRVYSFLHSVCQIVHCMCCAVVRFKGHNILNTGLHMYVCTYVCTYTYACK